jgi:hypothetical protein
MKLEFYNTGLSTVAATKDPNQGRSVTMTINIANNTAKTHIDPSNTAPRLAGNCP